MDPSEILTPANNEPLADEVVIDADGFSPTQAMKDGEVVVGDKFLDGEGSDGSDSLADAAKVEEVDLAGQWEYRSRNKFSALLNRLVPHGGALSNIYCMASVTLGSGIFSLPYAFRMTGIFTAVLVLVVITLATIYSVYLLMQAADKTGRTLRTYEALSRGLLGRGWDYLAAFNMWMFCFGSCVSYVISVGDLLKSATDGDSVNAFIRSTWGNRVLVIMIWAVVMLPLSIPKQVNSLRYASVIGVTFMMYFVVVIVVHACTNGFENGELKYELKAVRGGNDALIGFSMFLFSYLSQTNTPQVSVEMKKLTPGRLAGQTAISMSICTALYIIAGIFGYMDFGDALSGSVLLAYNVRQDVMVMIGYVGLGFKLCVSFAICMQPTRDSLYYCLGWNVRTVAFWKHAVACSAMSVLALILGLFIPKVEIVFGLVGSFCGGFIGFIFPAVFIMYAGSWGRKEVGWFHYISTYLLLMVGVIAVVFGTVAAIYGVIMDN